mmetsp:Transcript_33066/g.46946  ORF Transcript_33066/g.46946 Transcript_33066/m.46946 type:complete len:482 (-) Transcript_33066:114-1559(-)|eukprot:CAMPEP_0202446592 /NCGR_PEP_ID=MMETSP1360-20130828/5109_1 /ASSEMBLY_ACC=CAM_ASM_000848 /TAXON_ID=515479 /ORGANISM="Licmophora paradoxa, Strain CCMP2313" /LENGTH=481 /DNA_ID=CAMNT_0049063163 /DNA_START=30 /DNA_END=1475 /DNA_ORIENTATION=+
MLGPMQKKIEQYYRDIYSDLTVDREEAAELKEFIEEANPPPDMIVWLRATAFRIGCEFLTDENETNISLLRAINALVHAVETCRMQPKEDLDGSNFDEEAVTTFYQQLFEDLSVDQEENQDLLAFFAEQNTPSTDKLVYTRASAFRVGCDSLSDDRDTNIQLLRCINVVVHAFEATCLQPRPYQLRMVIPPEITVDEVGLDASMEKAIQHLWDLDANRLEPEVDYELNVQRGKKPYWKEDSAADPLFTRVNTREFQQRPTYRTFMALLDNYQSEVGISEEVTNCERVEIWTFLKTIMQTAPMQFCHKYCHANKPDKVPADQGEFLQLLHKIWFQLYHRSRGGREDSSGFEHVFVGEVKDDKVSGFHNWIQFYLEEKKGAVDYRGYIKPRNYNDAATNDDDHILTLQFAWNGVEKLVGTSFIGVSPEFEMAVYSTCFLVGGEENVVSLDTGGEVYELKIKCFTMARDKIGTTFPEALSHYEE